MPWRRRDTLATGTLVATAGIVAWAPVQPWMLGVWAVAAVVLAVVTGAVVLLSRESGSPGDATVPSVTTVLHRLFPGVAATACFAVIAVLAANLETPRYAGDATLYWLLGGDMVLVVALYLASYDRGRQKAPWK